MTSWQVDVSRSSAQFTVRNFAVKTVRGRIPIRSAAVETDTVGRPVAVRALLDITQIDTGNRRRDRDLSQPRLLDTERWPTLGFTGLLQATGTSNWQVPGSLTARGAAAKVVLDVTVTQDGEETRALATTAFDRRALGIRAPRLLIGYEVSVAVTAVLTPAPLPPSQTHHCAGVDRWPGSGESARTGSVRS